MNKKTIQDPMKVANKLAKQAAGMKNVHHELDTEGVYEILRNMHNYLKDIYYSKNYEKNFSKKQDMAITQVNNALYDAEKLFVDF